MGTEDTATTFGDIEGLVRSWARHLQAAHLSANTIANYRYAAERLHAHLVETGMPTDVGSITREHVEAHIAHLLATSSSSTAATRHCGLKQFFGWLEEESEIPASSMARMRMPKIDEKNVALVAPDTLRRLLDTCSSHSFDDRRDSALITLFIDSGAHLTDLADVDLGAAHVLGKGRRERALPLGTKAIKALDRYLRVRAQHREAELPNLWLGRSGPHHPRIQKLIRRRSTPTSSATPSPPVPVRRRQQRRPHTPRRLEIPHHAQPLRRLRRRRRRPRPRSPPPSAASPTTTLLHSAVRNAISGCSGMW